MDNKSIQWTTKHRQAMLKRAALGEHEWYRLSRFLQIILSLAIICNIILAVANLTNSSYSFLLHSTSVSLVIVELSTAVGAFLLLMKKKVGFYLLILTQILYLVSIYLIDGYLSPNDVVLFFGHIVFICGSLFINNKCKINTYDLLWPNKNVIRPNNYLELYDDKPFLGSENDE